ncbi:hypothetical protein CGH33_13535 [Vibrio parahaemolyticus]|nr:hypothetical protein CGH33_13535 [Vibrio parahaemolyticus]
MRGNRELSQFKCYSHAWEWGIIAVQVLFPCVGMGDFQSSSVIPMRGNRASSLKSAAFNFLEYAEQVDSHAWE